jgi:hypothetical protein
MWLTRHIRTPYDVTWRCSLRAWLAVMQGVSAVSLSPPPASWFFLLARLDTRVVGNVDVWQGWRPAAHEGPPHDEAMKTPRLLNPTTLL